MDRLGQMYPIIQATGGDIDVQELTRLYADYLGIPELANIITFQNPPVDQQPGQNGQGMPQNTTRNYVRHNVPTGGTPQARSQALQQSLYGSATPNQEQQLMRPGA